MKKLLYAAVTFMLNASMCVSMLPSYYSGHEDAKKRVVLSEVTDEEAIEKASEFYDVAVDLQKSGSVSPALQKYEVAFLGMKKRYLHLQNCIEIFGLTFQKRNPLMSAL